MKKQTIWIFLLVCLLCGAARADLSLPGVFSDNMVIQAGQPFHIRGYAAPGRKVTVQGSWSWMWGKSVRADAMGRWSCRISPPKPGGPYEVRIATDRDETVTLKNVLCGQVWLCSGQSNMQWPLKWAQNGDKEVENADDPEIRLYSVSRTVAAVPQSDTQGTWEVCRPDTAADFSAVGYFFGRVLREKLNQPVGLIHSSWGGTPAEAWTPMDVLKGDPGFASILATQQEFLDRYPDAMEKYRENWMIWKEEARKFRAKDKLPPPRPVEPRGPGNRHSPAGLYNAMIAPLTDFSIRGVIWYQGEANSSRSAEYTRLFPSMITSWRQKFDRPDMPFYFVQIAPFQSMSPGIRQAQLETYRKVPHTGIVVTTDTGEPGDIHPKNKQDVGKRLALWALSKTYGHKEIVCSGPIYREIEVEKQILSYDTQANTQTHRAKIRVFFDHVAGGLVAKDGPLRGFEVAGLAGEFRPAMAKIEGDTVVVWSQEVRQPVDVRYGWENVPDVNLYNSAGLPASPFTTEDWKGHYGN